MRLASTLLLLLALAAPPLAAQQWYAVQGKHTVAYSEANTRSAREAARRAEQVIAIYAQLFQRHELTFAAPIVLIAGSGQPSSFVRTPMAVYITVDPAQPESLAAMATQLAALTLEDNYPRARPWFDRGIVAYIGGTRFGADQLELGATTSLPPPEPADWIPFDRLFALRDLAALTPAAQRAFAAESFALVRWIAVNNRMAQVGDYLTAVEWRGTSQERALAESFRLAPADLEREVRESWFRLPPQRFPVPTADPTLYPERKVSAAEMHVLRSCMAIFTPQGEAAFQELQAFMRQEQENVAVHRALAWAFLEHHDNDNAMEHVRHALAIEDTDPAMHYLYSLLVNEGDRVSIRSTSSAVPRLGTELKLALQRDPNYADALELLGLAELADSMFARALPDLQRASALRPRNERYYFNLALAYEAAGNAEAQRNLLLYIRGGSDPLLVAEATRILNEGLNQKRQLREHGSSKSQVGISHSRYDNLQDALAEDEAAENAARQAHAAPDQRRTEHLKGRIVKTECSEKGATLHVTAEGHAWTMHVADRDRVSLIGVARFDCTWHGQRASINYKSSGEYEGDVISLEPAEANSR